MAKWQYQYRVEWDATDGRNGGAQRTVWEILADLWIKIGEELHYLRSKEVLIEGEHVKALLTKKERQHMSPLEKFITESNEKADELAKEGAMLDGGFIAQAKASTVQQERDVRSLAVWC